uniref:Ig-like domain-containing protein n=1 Tax=Myripristis murdjan TaxID=586833 RepID=A0A667Z2E2_9TELE
GGLVALYSLSRKHSNICFRLIVFHLFSQSQLIGPPQPIVAIVGDDTILPCHLEPAMDVGALPVEWTRPDLNPQFVHTWREGVELLVDHHPSYEGRTSLFMDKLKDGDISLKLS